MKALATKTSSIKMLFMKVPSFGPLEDVPCPLCGSDDNRLITVNSVFGEDFRVVRCKQCRLIRTNPRPTAKWKRRFHDPKYNGYMETLGRDFVYLPPLRRVSTYHLILKFLIKRLPSGARVLDLGCAIGDFMKVAKEYGFDVWGCDYSQSAVNHAREKHGLLVVRGQAENIPFDDSSFDAVTLLQLLEHLPDPLGALKEINRVLRPSGLLFIETPNYLPYYYVERYLSVLVPLYCKITGRVDLPWYPFVHLCHWTSATILTALSKTGFERCETHFIENYRAQLPLDGRLSLGFRLYSSLGKLLYRLTGSAALDFRPAIIATALKKG